MLGLCCSRALITSTRLQTRLPPRRLLSERTKVAEVVPEPATDAAAMGKTLGIGLVAGGFGSLVGMGGAFVAVPAMTGILGISQHMAHGTSLASVMTVGSGGAMSYASTGNVDWETAAFMAGAGMLAARFGARMTQKLDPAKLKIWQGWFQILVAPSVILKAYFTKPERLKRRETIRLTGQRPKSPPLDWTRVAKLSCIGLGSGFTAGLFGVGGGAIIVPALSIFLDMDHLPALGTSLAAMVPAAAVGTYTYYTHGYLRIGLAVPLAMGSFTGSFFGAKYVAKKIDEDHLRWGFVVLLTGLGIISIRSGRKTLAAKAAAQAVAKKL